MPATFDKPALLAELREGLMRYLAAGAEVVSDSAKLERLTGMTPPELDRLCAVHFLMSDEVTTSVDLLPELVRRLPSTAIVDHLETRGHVQGQIHWPKTVQLRLRTQDRSTFVCSRPERRYETPQGRLLKATVENLHDALRRTKWLGLNPLEALPSTTHHRGPLRTRILEMARIVEPLLDSRKLREVSRLNLHPEVLSALRSRPTLGPLCDAYISYQELVVAREPTALLNALSARFFAPDADRLFELVVGFRLVESFRRSGWVEKPPRGLLGSRIPVASLSQGARSVRIFWQTSVWDTETATLSQLSSGRLQSIIQSSGSSIRRYRPDLIVEFVNSDRSRTIWIGEVKLTGLEGTRAEAAGVIEALGYLKDADPLQSGDVHVRGFVVAWNASGRPSADLIAISDQDRIGDLVGVLQGDRAPSQ